MVKKGTFQSVLITDNSEYKRFNNNEIAPLTVKGATLIDKDLLIKGKIKIGSEIYNSQNINLGYEFPNEPGDVGQILKLNVTNNGNFLEFKNLKVTQNGNHIFSGTNTFNNGNSEFKSGINITGGSINNNGREITTGTISGATSITSTDFIGNLNGDVTSPGNCSGTVATVTGAAQPNIHSLGTFTDLTVDQITINNNIISSTTSNDLRITPANGNSIVLDSNIYVDAGEVTGATSISSTDFHGYLHGDVLGNCSGTVATVTGGIQPNIHSLGTLTTLRVGNINIDGNTISSTSGNINITPATGSSIVLDNTINIDGGGLTHATSISSTNFYGNTFIGNVTGNVTVSGNCTESVATVTEAAQTDITSVGELTALTINNDLIMNKDHNLIIQNNTSSGNENINIGIGTDTILNSSYHNSSKIKNIGIGVGSLNSITAGQQNIGIGYDSLKRTQGLLLHGDTDQGNRNISIGTFSMERNTIGKNNSAFGQFSLSNNINGDNNVTIGYEAFHNNHDGNNNTMIGTNSGSSIFYGNGNDGDNNVCIGYHANVTSPGHTHTNQIVIGYNAESEYRLKSIRLGNGIIQHFECHVELHHPSDKRIKKNIIDNDLGLDFITKLRTVKYNKVNPADYPEEIREKRFLGETPDEKPEENNNLYDGLIAQEVEEVLTNINKSWCGHHINENNGKQALDYDILTIPLIKAVQELKQKNDELKSNIIKFKESINLK